MTETRLSDIIVPEVFNPNVIEQTAEKIRFLQSGIVTPVGDISIGSGTTIQIPFYQDLSGADSVWDDTNDITLNNISMAKSTAVVLTREQAWAATDLARELGQQIDPMGAIVSRVSDYWARRYEAALLSSVNGAMASFSDNTLDISGLSGTDSHIDGEAFVDATQKLGDSGRDLTDMAVHSAVEANLRKQDLIDFIPDSEGKLTIEAFQGRRLHVDDSMPEDSGVYTTYLFGQGAVGLVDEMVPNANETYRHPEKSGGTDALYTRRKFLMHPHGISWDPASGVPSSSTPSNSELADSGNWTRKYEPKNIKIVRFLHTVS
ncbi:MAG: methyltransferase [Verrucomicrobia bacterium]|jgi:hypothetical protein|nr:methyltransferase [Verrucomicrobiota bacterium]